MFEEALLNLINSYGLIGLFLVMIIQTIIAPIPSEMMLIFAGSIGLDTLGIVLYGGTGMIVGAILAFYIGRVGREAVVKRLIGEEWISEVDVWVEKHGTLAILVSRLIPIIPFDLISYVSGLTSLSFKDYAVATILGAYPRTLMLALLGSSIGATLQLIGFTLETIILLAVIAVFLYLLLEKMGYVAKIKDWILRKTISKPI